MTVGLFMTSTDVITLVAGIKYTDAGTSLAILSIATMFSMFAYMYTNCVIIPLKKEKVTLYASILSAIVNVGLNFLLIPILGINAAAITTVIAEAIMCVISIIYSRKIITLKNVGKCVITTVISCVLIVLLCLIHSEIENLIIRITVKVISSVILYFVSMRLMKNEIIMEYLDMFKNKIYKLRRNKV
jgi:O-antigen/teichoic acid export membrane protein